MANLLNITITPLDGNTTVCSLQELKDHCNCDTGTWDTAFPTWEKVAVQALQMFTGCVFLPSNVKAVYAQHGEADGFYPMFSNGATITGNYAMDDFGFISTTDSQVKLEYTAGNVEEWMKHAVKLYVADLFDNRGDQKTGEIGKDAKSYCMPFIKHGFL